MFQNAKEYILVILLVLCTTLIVFKKDERENFEKLLGLNYCQDVFA